MELLDFQYKCGDAFDFCKKLSSDSIKLIITSPPYNIGKEYETKTSIDEYISKLKPILKEFVRVLQPNGSLCWQVGNYVENGEIYPLDIYFYPYFKKLGLHLRNRIIWHFGHGLHCSKRFSGRYETILWFTKTDNYTFNLDNVRVPSKYPGKRYFKGAKKVSKYIGKYLQDMNIFTDHRNDENYSSCNIAYTKYLNHLYDK